MKNLHIISLFLLFPTAGLVAQATLEGYVYEQFNRGYLQQAKVTVYEFPSNIVKAELQTDTLGHFKLTVAPGSYRIFTRKDVFFDRQDTVTVGGDIKYLKIEMRRKPGYLFDVTLAESRDNPDEIVDAVEGAAIEIYNNTLERPELTLKNHPTAFFQYTFEQGNHYTVLIRKPGYLVKRIEVYVNIKGCILCVDGVRSLTPGVTENLTAGNTMGTLVANIELDRARVDKRIQVQNIYYDYDKWDILPESAEQLDKVVTLMRDNPGITVELGSHTDSRGNDAYNLKLSGRRAAAAVAYIVQAGIDSARISFRGYGETQLVNRCKNGVSCSEEDHRMNRRTELKITKVRNDALEAANWLTLEQIIIKEKQEKAAKTTAGGSSGRTDLKPGTTQKDGVPPGGGSSPVEALKTSSATTRLQGLPQDYRGYAIELFQTARDLGPEDPLFKGLEVVFFQKEPDGTYFYYLGNLGVKEKVFDIYNRQILTRFKDAKVANFTQNGKIYLK